MAGAHITVVGAGVTGLTTAYLLSKNPGYHITVVAKFMPGDYDIGYTSPWAGANYFPMGDEGSFQAELEAATWPELYRLALHFPGAGIHTQETRLGTLEKDIGKAGPLFDQGKLPWWSDIVPDFRILPKEELRPGEASAFAFTSVCINAAIYLPWLASQCLEAGVKFKRAVVEHIAEAADLSLTGHKADLVVNCSALGSLTLGGVQDKKMTPIRGQTVVVRNEPKNMSGTSSTDHGDSEMVYVMARGAAGGTILGGCYQIGNWDPKPDMELAKRIMQRCIDLNPELTNGEGIEALSIIRHGVGLRPYRAGGVRIEKELIRGLAVVHAYGHAGWGYQGSYGSANAVVKLVEETLEAGERKFQAKL